MPPDATTSTLGSKPRPLAAAALVSRQDLFFKKNYGTTRTLALRAVLAGLTAAKLAAWCAVAMAR
jgi:hypothetical protein